MKSKHNNTMTRNPIFYEPFDEGKTYEIFAELLFGENNIWRFCFCENLCPKTTMLIDINLTNESGISTLKRYIKSFRVGKIWWRLSCDENYHTLDYIKRLYGDWDSFKYLNNIFLEPVERA